jgi:AcrR family transcriptional regulator
VADPARGGRYHHGDLRAALVDAAIGVIAERGLSGFSLSEASRRVGVAPSAPYAHFKDRDALLAAVAVRAYEVLHRLMVTEVDPAGRPAERLAAMARCYVGFAAHDRALFDVLAKADLDFTAHPEIKAAERPIDETLGACVSQIARGRPSVAEALAVAAEATAHGFATMLLEGDFGQGATAVSEAADRAAAATLALVAGRRLLAATTGH